MATHLDLEEQEQLDELKHFWKQYGNAITWILIAVLSAFAAWNGYQYWQRNQATQAASLLDEIEKSVRAGDTSKIQRSFGEMKDRFASTAYAQQAALLVGKSLFDMGQVAGAKEALSWAAEKSADSGYASLARLRLAGIAMESKNFDEALKALDGKTLPSFDALVMDRRGDIYIASGKKNEAKDAYLKAYQGLETNLEYRRLVEVKLNALGIVPTGVSK